MSILVNADTRVVVQGMTGGEGSFHTRGMVEYGTRVVAGVTPGKGGQAFDGIPVFNTVRAAVAETGANASVIFVPPPYAADAIMEAADADVGVVVCITEGIPAADMVRVARFLEGRPRDLVGDVVRPLLQAQQMKLHGAPPVESASRCGSTQLGDRLPREKERALRPRILRRVRGMNDIVLLVLRVQLPHGAG